MGDSRLGSLVEPSHTSGLRTRPTIFNVGRTATGRLSRAYGVPMSVSNQPDWTDSDGDVTVVSGLSHSATVDEWTSWVISFIDRIARADGFAIHDNGFHRFPEVLIVEGVGGQFEGHDFRLWSDVSGELVITIVTSGGGLQPGCATNWRCCGAATRNPPLQNTCQAEDVARSLAEVD